jgi:hypothetical protein
MNIKSRLGKQKWTGRIYLVIVTDGVPTPTQWTRDQHRDMQTAKDRMVQQLRQISSEFPVTLVVRSVDNLLINTTLMLVVLVEPRMRSVKDPRHKNLQSLPTPSSYI